jgi:hypothetical protein
MAEKLAKKVSYAFGSHATRLLTFHIVKLGKAISTTILGWVVSSILIHLFIAPRWGGTFLKV